MGQKTCEKCSSVFHVIPCREATARYCSRGCSDKAKVSKKESCCSYCGVEFHRKPYQLTKNGKLGVFCSVTCSAKFKSTAYLGENNPNNRNRLTDQDGYRIYSPQVSTIFTGKKMKMHTAVAQEVLNIEAIPKGFHVHHRDCDVLNNNPANLALLTISDHVWLHKQFGSATLWAYSREKVSLDSIVSWAADQTRASKLLTVNLLNQKGEIMDEEAGTAIAQGMIVDAPQVSFSVVQELSDTERGTAGFGSTDK